MKLVESILSQNPCYTAGKKIKVMGLMLHSVGCPQPQASVFVDSWNNPSHSNSCAHGFIDGNDGTVYQTLPWEHRGWHCASGSKGSGNNTHIGIEMCEPACIKYTSGASFTCSDMDTAKAVVKRTYESAVELFAMLCKKFNLDPLADGVVISHKEGHDRGIASNHGDPEHLWSQLGMGYTMDGFRQDVKMVIDASVSESIAGELVVEKKTETADVVEAESKEKAIWDFLTIECGLNSFAAAGVMGNLYAESGLRPDNLQNSFEKKLDMDDVAYTAAVDSGAYNKNAFINDKAGYGLAQWTYWSRKQALYEYAKTIGVSIADMHMQLSFFWKEVTEKVPFHKKLQNASSVLEASNAVLHDYERPADQSETVEKKRAEYGQAFYDLFAKEKQSGVSGNNNETFKETLAKPFLVRVNTSYLNIRKKPGTNYAKTGKYTGIGVFTIVEVQPGEGSDSGWGLLKSYADDRDGWISLDVAERV